MEQKAEETGTPSGALVTVLFFKNILWIWVFCLHERLCILFIHTLGDQKRSLDLLGQKVVRHHVPGIKLRTFQLLSHLFSPSSLFLKGSPICQNKVSHPSLGNLQFECCCCSTFFVENL